ncbi:RNA polymerase sigma-54 factor [Arenicella chitinivorans]|uniref:RNA polymerase sigma-54 factor n=1 Tax=Arenicella chitinivorans TaxID=1329800 RepID=A0A918RPG6_9GAMM|nr:RNA polymerase factor sigma-54 [Arenicella chitinivorans]GHA04159.1 RNA polymerase sigma-54 factor [Arenicella chitinivorans]
MKQSLNLKLSQQLTLTPQLKQSLKLLQLPALELEQEVQQALDSNPLLERVESEQTDLNGGDETLINQPNADTESRATDTGTTDATSELADDNGNWQETFESHRVSNVSTGSGGTDTEFTQFVSKQESLFEHLDWQIQMTTLSAKDKQIANALLRCLDDEGYLNAELAEVTTMIDADVDEDEVHAVLSLIKTLEPIGVGARNLNERLNILLDQLPPDTGGLELAKQIVSEHLDLVGTRNLAKLKKSLNVSERALSESLNLITHLNPRIGGEFKSDNQNYIIPDVHIKKVNGVWRAHLNPDNQVKLRLNQTYSDMLKRDIDKEGSEFIQQNLLEAKMFIKGLMSRYDTLLLVAEAIIERQQAFFEQGDQAMQPMVLQDIAEQLEMHESTISRATAGKYLLSPRGVFELKYFFSSALNSTDGTASSSTAIRSLIRKMVDAESKAKPLSDSKIAKELEQQGHIVARRTVAKYRESMQIAPSSQRKSLV